MSMFFIRLMYYICNTKGNQIIKHMTTETAIKNISFGKYRFETFEDERSGKQYAFAKMYLATPKATYRKEKCLWYYRFNSELEREAHVNKEIESLEKRVAEKITFKESKKNLINPFKVGEIFYNSWGYEQTNIDFYQIVEAAAKSVKIRPIGKSNEGECGFMSNYVAPVKDLFIGEPETKILQMLKSGEVYIKSRHGWISKWDREKITESHYA